MTTSMKSSTSILWLLIITCYVLCLSSSNGRKVSGTDDEKLVKIRGVNLGGWLVIEGWITPSLFDDIPNKDLLDGSMVQLKSAKSGKYLSAEFQRGEWIVTEDSRPTGLANFKVWRINETTFNFRVPYNKQFLGLDGNVLVSVAKVPGARETFQIVRSPHDKYRVRIKAPNGFYLQVKRDKEVTADCEWRNGGWSTDEDPSVFKMTVVIETEFAKASPTMLGDFQLANGHGPYKASHVLTEHWRRFITEKDFKFMSKHGVNGVRIPVGWWIASDPTPPWPYVGGSLQALDNAFSWAEKYKMKVIIDLHALPGSQNGFYHGSSRDGLDPEWGQTDETINQSVRIVEFLACRYKKSSSLHGIGLLNEPVAPRVTLEMTNKYYKAAYDAVRRHSPTAYILFARRIWPPGYSIDPLESFPLMKNLSRTVYDLHFYNLFRSDYKNLTVQQNIELIQHRRIEQMNYVNNASGADGPLVLVGEWADEWETLNATEADYKRYAQVQKEVYDRATFGWCYWTLKHVINHWSFRWMINNGYIKIT